ncbi:MAG TPA: hypothetical protein VFR78_22425 [Pyrinomonadaceae bacterium]|nr:hypothetical protein [Pyrinomonadaceae bacterium]
MHTRTVLSALLLALFLCFTVQAQTAQAEAQPEEPDLETQLYLIVGTNQDVEDSRMPPSLDPVVKQMRSTLPFKNYRLAATLINRVKNEGRLDLSWIGGPMASAVGATSQVTPSFSQFKVRQVKVVRNSEGRPVVQMLGFHYGARIPIQTSPQVAANGTIAPAFNYENTGLATDISMREAEPVIVGTLNVGPSGDAIILVVSAKRTSK